MEGTGTLWLVATPIGNLADISQRARDVLASVDVIACEDTRRTRGLLSHLGIAAPKLVALFDANERRRIPEILRRLTAGVDVALVTDAGTPAISDPGYRLVAACAEEGIDVDVVPGPSAAVAALVLSGLPTDRFAFEGFLPSRAGQRRARLAAIADEERTLVLYEAPHRVLALLRDAHDALGDRRAAVVRELTKVHQEVLRATLSELAGRLADREIRGEFVVVIAGAVAERASADPAEIAARVERLTAEGMSRRDAAARVARETGASRREAYEASLRRR
ncbi:MAG TPA: 16S rRNA (cytidine(1402)-2'-O)-methyltransferase [Actinomycetota bacterium]|nr:16S rRNA (cytidine(1402)-2'-O)-methyltransferase [Actinomycetota bacterium]